MKCRYACEHKIQLNSLGALWSGISHIGSRLARQGLRVEHELLPARHRVVEDVVDVAVRLVADDRHFGVDHTRERKI